MAQADRIITAIPQLLSRGPPSKSASLVRLAHTELIGALAGNVPHAIYVEANSDDLDDRAEHLEKVFEALQASLTIVLSETAQNIPGGALNRGCLDHVFQDLSADAPCLIRHAAEEMREHNNWRAS
jgi:hypothetical protein